MINSLNRVTLAILLGFAAVMLSLTYWTVIGPDSLLSENYNLRRDEAERAVVRGALYDRNEQLLARSIVIGTSPSDKPIVRREYPHPDAVGVVGYYRLVSAAGAEAAFDQILRGVDTGDAGKTVADQMLHRA